ncbi:SagB/ThcOx family dehydrogenase [Nonomuraea sp. KC401]|uniref:SagB/ThcOx family dehydrogenase n=1 Tax=unclassified Nonomuraea TaxID=2593643 RepID=UPI0010FE0112|nr:MULTISPECIES: SagB family peptide dehydrogenase [unclassified Nonomuraea]NBE96555.1 SagB/ThcOx family dehydrogenase [Nonomuraea sp. K271]TLF86343.1 SagB/ThcOx family dehydrogenase [Nonomuraea sp. KC401]
MNVHETVVLRPDATLERTPEGHCRLVVRSGARSQGLGRVDDPHVLETLATTGMPFTGDDVVTDLWRRGWLSLIVSRDDTPVLTLHPHADPPPRPSDGGTGRPVSELAVLRKVGEDYALESARAWCSVRVEQSEELPALLTGKGDLFHYLDWAGLTGDEAESTQLALAQWTPHELAFHHQTRIPGVHRATDFGRSHWGTRRFAGLPARHERFRGEGITLAKPDLAGLRQSDQTVTAVLEKRRTIRDHDDEHPLTVVQLGHLLFRCARNRWLVQRNGSEYLSRPYPSGGSAYELEIYPVVRNVTGLDPGLYHYDPQEHRLRYVSEHTGDLLAHAAVVAGAERQPQVLLIITARFGRLMRTYRGMSYALILKHVGIVQQVMYTVATAMGLAVCALGDGDATAFASATGLDPMSEASVGELALGSRPTRVNAGGV